MSQSQDSSNFGTVSLEEMLFVVDMLVFMLDMTKRHQISFMKLVGHIFKSFVKPMSINPHIKIHSLITMKEADSLLLSGVDSIYNNFPVENVTIIDKHAYISLSQKVDNTMAHGIKYHIIVMKIVIMEIEETIILLLGNWKKG